ncbi:MAG: DNA-processing protein DprA [Clostridiales bacterium]|nr:DNA-processing protein DprA [Clostridiales bacterium]
MSSDEYWIWLQSALKPGARVDELIAEFGDAQGVYQATENQLKISGTVTPAQLEKISETPISCVQPIIKECLKKGWQIVTPDSEYYPKRFRQLKDFPLVLYVNGDLEILKSNICISIVGTRQASRYGLEVTRRLSAQLVSAGAVVVSGGALGVDSASHIGAIMGKGKTVAYLGCGLSSNYLMENAALRKSISENGAVVSEFPPMEAPTRRSFPIRNRLISGMSLGTIVIEAGEKSGSLITARFALEQGRDVFAVPGNIISSAYTGANKLIREGAKPVFSAADVLEEYINLYPDEILLEKADEEIINFGSASADKSLEIKTKPKTIAKKATTEKLQQKAVKAVEKSEQTSEPKARQKQPVPVGVSEVARKIYELFGEGEVHIDEIADMVSLDVSEVLSAVTELELFGVIRATNGRRYTLDYKE